ncbi:MAG: hypothetical protein LC099_10165 [Anaerolineales bacterium]|nr:hypothetical protein [Anaerolineales bacterium]
MIALTIILVAAFLLLGLTLWKKRSPSPLREIPAFDEMTRSLDLSVEDGKRLHLSLGRGDLLNSSGASALAGLALLRSVAERASVGDKPPVASSGDAALGLLSQDTLRAGYQAASADDAHSQNQGRVTGLSPFSYAAGAMSIPQSEDVSTTMIFGHLGAEAALLADSVERSGANLIGASDHLEGQAVLFAETRNALVGEELFAANAYLNADPSHDASLTLQDIFRWLIILALLGGSAAKFLGMF